MAERGEWSAKTSVASASSSEAAEAAPLAEADESEFLTLDFSPHKESVHRWRKLPDCDEFVGPRRSKHTSVAYKGALFVFGGDNGKQMLNDMLRFDLHDLSWGRAFTMGNLPDPRYHHSAIVHESSMYVFGGYTGDIHNNSNLTNRNDLYEYKFGTGQWSQVRVEEPLPPARSAHGATVWEDRLYIFGGFDGHKRLNDLWRIPLTGPIRRWERVEQSGDIPPPCCNFSSALAEGSWYLFSGQSGAAGSSHLYQLDVGSAAWRRLSSDHILRAAAAPPLRRYGHSMVGHGGRLYVFGGAGESVLEPELHVYDLRSHSWDHLRLPADQPDRPSGRLFHSAHVIQDSMFVFGGMTGIGNERRRSNQIYRFQFSGYPRCTLAEDFGRLLESRQLCDLRFLVGKDRVPIFAHIAVVAARSRFLRRRIMESRETRKNEAVEAPAPSASSPRLSSSPAFSPKEASAGRSLSVLDVPVADAEPFAFEMILAYMYTDAIDPTQRGQEPRSNGVVLLMMEVYRLSLAFAMQRLQSLAIKYLESMIDLSNVLLALGAASRLRLADVKDHCLRIIVKENHFHQVVMSKEFESLEQALMVELVRRRQAFRTGQGQGQAPPAGPFPQGQAEEGPEEESGLKADMEAFLEEAEGGDFCDITLVANDTAIPAHKVILASRSAYFEAIFRNWMPSTNMVSVQLGDVVPSGKAFRSLLRYVYFGAVDMPPEDSLFLFAAPPFYGFTNNRLQVFCKENLETNIRTENVLEMLEAAHKIQANEMKRHALSKIVANFSTVAKTHKEKLSGLERQLLLDIIDAVAEGNGEGVSGPCLSVAHSLSDASA